ncbi:MAG: hypothetical protein ACXV79_10735 [Methylobacter sp.]
MKELTNYQTRMTKLVWSGRFYSIVGFTALVFIWFEFSKDAFVVSTLIFFSTQTLWTWIAIASDAVYDSINERIIELKSNNDL